MAVNLGSVEKNPIAIGGRGAPSQFPHQLKKREGISA
jgi:hypothetical protein